MDFLLGVKVYAKNYSIYAKIYTIHAKTFIGKYC